MMVTYQIKPDRYLVNDQTEHLADSFSALYETPMQRTQINLKSKEAVRIQDKNHVWWEAVFAKENISYYLTTGEAWGKYIQSQLETCWPKATIEPVNDEYMDFDIRQAAAVPVTLGKHYFLSLITDKRILSPLPELCEVVKALSDNDKAILQIGIEPADKDWWQGCEDAYKKFKEGGFPKRLELSGPEVAKGIFKLGALIGLEVMATTAEMLTGAEHEVDFQDTDRGIMLHQGGLSRATLSKSKGEGFDIVIRLIAVSESKQQRDIITRSMAAALRSLNEDNELTIRKEPKPEKLLQAVKDRAFPFIKVNRDYVSPGELAKLLQLPPFSLQQEYPIDSIENREIAVPEHMTRDGLLYGNVKHKGLETAVYMPINNHDELCLTEIVIGGLGTGKSLGRGAGKAADAIRKGFSTFIIDVADGDLANTVRDSLPKDFPNDHLIDLDFGNRKYCFPLNWNESASQLDNMDFADELSNQLTAYFQKFADEAGDRTNRYVKAAGRAVFANPDNTLLEVILMLCSEAYRRQLYGSIKDPRLSDLWRDFDNMSEGMRASVIAPILNRFDVLVGSRYLANSIFQKPKDGKERLDFREFADGDRHPYCVILRCPKSVLKRATDPLVTFLIAKIWLAVLTRYDTITSRRKPCFLIMDEPHQFLGSAKGGMESTWGEMLSESRKWRLGLTFMFHDWGQIPRELASLMKNSMPHYTLYTTGKETYTSLKEEISPFTVEEALETPTHQAINVIRSGNQYYKFMAQMAPPPIDVKKLPFRSWRYEYIDRSWRTSECLKQYGRLREEVELDIYQREKVLYQEPKKTKK